jgi:hypothetical protein
LIAGTSPFRASSAAALMSVAMDLRPFAGEGQRLARPIPCPAAVSTALARQPASHVSKPCC